jgi:Spherulation-specific family 4
VAQPTPALVVVGGAWIGLTIALVAMLVHGRADHGPATCREALIPAYLPPRELTRLAHAARRPQMVVVNPDSGPGTGRSHAYISAVHLLQAAGVRVLGYVPTGYGWRPVQNVIDDVDRYQAWYGVDGIFFDEAASDAALVSHYRALAHAARGDAARLVVLNPGVPPAPAYFDLANLVVTFEGDIDAYAGAMRETPEWLRRQPRDRVAHLIYGATRAQALSALADSAAGYLYATSGALPNPWRTLPPYLDDEVEALTTCG